MERLNLIPTLIYTIRHLNYGDSLYLSGSHPLLGSWSFENSLELLNSDQNIWYQLISLPDRESIDYKFIVSKSKKQDHLQMKWDEGPNNKITISSQKEDPSLSVMSFNIRYENEIDGENSWSLRKELVTSIILSNLPDLLGLQESKLSQTNFLKERLEKEYGNYSRGRDYNDLDESVGIFYKKKRFVLLDKGTFWLSENRHKAGSMLKDSYFPRIVSWVKFFDQYKKEFLWYFNTHFDHLSSKIRQRNAEILIEEIEKICGLNENIVLSGDLNANDGEDCINLIKKKLKDCSSKKENEYTFHNFWGVNTLIGKIDFIFVGKGFECLEFRSIKTSEKRKGKERYPSDHFPIQTFLNYK